MPPIAQKISSRTLLDRGKSVSSQAALWQVVIVLLAVYIYPAHAQYGASLQGTVTDQSGSVISGARAQANIRQYTVAHKDNG